MKLAIVTIAGAGAEHMLDRLENGRLATLEERNEEILLAVSNLYFSIASVNLDTAQIMFIKNADGFDQTKVNTDRYPEALRIIGETYFHPDDRERFLHDFSQEKLREREQCGILRYSEEYQRNIRGEWRWVTCTAFSTQQNTALRVVTIVLQDVHEQIIRRREQKQEEIEKEERTKELLREALNHAKQASVAKSDFLSRMSHDLRTPMNAIMGMAVLAEGYINDPDQMRECLRKISMSSQHMMEIINEVLNMSKIESGKSELEEDEFRLSDLLESTLAIIRPMAERKRQHIRVQVLNIVHESVFGDRTKMQQIFSNIMSNAYKYTPECGMIKLTMEELSTDSKLTGSYRFTFQDTGIGMTQDYLQHIFEPFSRASDLRISKTEGTGLGMAITWNFVQMMGGDICVESQVDEGTTITVTIPLKQKKQEQLPSREWKEKAVLIVDDDAEGRQNLKSLLYDFDMQVEEASSVEDALYRIHKLCWVKKNYDAVIIDRTLNGIDGVELAKKIRGIAGTEKTAILLCSYDCLAVKWQAGEAGIDALLTKPLFRSQVSDVLISLSRSTSFGWMKEEPEPVGIEGKRILLVEDNELNQEIAVAMLKTFGVCVESAENGAEAVRMFEEAQEGYFDLIFMDIQMPVMNGYEAAKTIRHLIRTDAAEIPIVAMTADAFSEDVQRALNAGMNEHISKPISREKLREIMDKWLNGSRVGIRR